MPSLRLAFFCSCSRRSFAYRGESRQKALTCFRDVCRILLDAVCSQRPQSREAASALALCNGGGDKGFVTAGSLKDAYYVLERQYSEPVARDAVRHLMDLLIIASLGGEECALALASNEADFEDGLVRACAELNDIDLILARDAGAYRNAMIRAVDCATYLAMSETAPAGSAA